MPLLLDLFLQRPCSSRYAATLTRRTTANSRCFSTSRCWREDKTAQPQTPATETIELAVVRHTTRL